MRTSRLLVLTVAGGIVAAAVPFLTAPAYATDYTASGTIQLAATTDVSVTNTRFGNSHCHAFGVNGLDAYVFKIPATYAVDGATATFHADSSVVHDFGVYVYNSDCTFDRKNVTASSFDLTTHLGPNDQYFVVFSETGSNIPVALTVTPPANTTYYDEGAILESTPIGLAATDVEFSLACTLPPASQGTDAFVFPIPSGTAVGTTVNINAVGALATHDFAAAVYNSDCSTARLITDASSDLSFATESGDTYVSVWSLSGANLWPELTI